MSKIITTTQAQKRMCEIANNIQMTTYIVTNRGQGKVVMLPYFDGCQSLIEDYLEDYEIELNKEALKKKWKKSSDSGPSGFVI